MIVDVNLGVTVEITIELIIYKNLDVTVDTTFDIAVEGNLGVTVYVVGGPVVGRYAPNGVVIGLTPPPS